MNNLKYFKMPEDKVVVIITVVTAVFSVLVTGDLWQYDTALKLIAISFLMLNIVAMGVITIIYVLLYTNIDFNYIAPHFDIKMVDIKIKNYFAIPIAIAFSAIVISCFIFKDYNTSNVIVAMFVTCIAYVITSTYRVVKLYTKLHDYQKKHVD
ncbi:hypothetical protein IMX26_05525 [Clostridium sp. 'deep sea']|uniref:hypothetical protein n=1 Tax=Clostridium sp. 'deep sea' TaxID=2779445 RepID=UPI00189653B8|nr:hypothetical protein [Clostridium sp. 'deep sea']QOR36273.1 hypothetical protein IMX26_05525 [Clostridium sp. 'deep sea']